MGDHATTKQRALGRGVCVTHMFAAAARASSAARASETKTTANFLPQSSQQPYSVEVVHEPLVALQQHLQQHLQQVVVYTTSITLV